MENSYTEKELTTILETTIDGFFIADMEGNITRVNSAFCKMLGYERQELIKMNVFDIEARETEEEINRRKQIIMKKGYDRFQTKHRKKDGHILDVEISATIFTVEKPQLVVFIRDISEQNKARLELEKREKEFSVLFMDSPVSILIHDPHTGKIIDANKKALSIYRAETVEELNFLDLINEPPYSYTQALKWIKKTVNEGPQEFEWRSKRKTGEYFWEKISLKLMNYNGTERIMATNIDITELKEAQRNSEAAVKAKAEFLSNMSHEIRTPLNGIIGFADLLKNTPLNATQTQFLHSVCINANSLLDIVNDILDFSQTEEGKLELEESFSDLQTLLSEALEVIQYEASKKGLEVLLNIEDDIPYYIYTDYSRLKQVLVNLLSNAIKFTEEGRVEVTVRFTPTSSEIGNYHFSIRDTGIGMDGQQQRKLFKAFTQGDTSTTKKFGGTGLGLILSQRIAQKMGSEIKFESQLKSGTTFYFDLRTKYRKKQEDESIPNVTHKKNTRSEVVEETPRLETNQRPSFLIVDDVETSRFLFREYLKEFDQNIRILEAKNGEEAVKIMKTQRPDLILMDLFMPVLDGLTATKMIRDFEEKQQIKRSIIFALTATATKDQENECYSMGMDGYLTKPLKKAQLYEKILEFWKPQKAFENNKADQTLHTSDRDELTSILNTLKNMLMRNDLSAIDFLDKNGQKIDDLGYNGSVRKLRRKIIDLKYNDALHELEKNIKTSPKSSK